MMKINGIWMENACLMRPIYFQQDGAPPQYVLPFQQNKMIGRRGPIESQGRSPDWTPLLYRKELFKVDSLYLEPQNSEELRPSSIESLHIQRDIFEKAHR